MIKPPSERAIDELVALLEDHQENERSAFVLTQLGDIVHVTPRYDPESPPIVATYDKCSHEFVLTMAGVKVPVRCGSAGTAFESIRTTLFGARPLKLSP